MKEEVEPLVFRKSCSKELITDPTFLIGAATWTLEEGVNLLATFKAENSGEMGEDIAVIFPDCWSQIYSAVEKTLETYELREKTFLIHADEWGTEQDKPLIAYYNSTVYPDKFIEWAKDISLPVPDDFDKKLMRAQKRHIANRSTSGPGSITAKEKRELGRLRREQESFDLAIKATVKAVQYCIKVNRRVKRDEFLDLLTSGKDGISKALLERILPLLPSEYRNTSGAPSTCKIGDANETDN